MLSYVCSFIRKDYRTTCLKQSSYWFKKKKKKKFCNSAQGTVAHLAKHLYCGTHRCWLGLLSVQVQSSSTAAQQQQIRLCGVRSQLARSYIGRAGCADGCLSFQPVRGSSFPRSRPPLSRVPHLLTWPISLRRLYPLLSPLSPPPLLFFTVISLRFLSNQLPPLTPLSPCRCTWKLTNTHTHTHTHISNSIRRLFSWVLVNNLPPNSDDYREQRVINHLTLHQGTLFSTLILNSLRIKI